MDPDSNIAKYGEYKHESIFHGRSSSKGSPVVKTVIVTVGTYYVNAACDARAISRAVSV